MAKINQQEITFLTASEEGPVGQDIDLFAQEIVHFARDEIREILRDFEGNLEEVLDAVDYEIVESVAGVEAFIGIRDTGKLTRYLAQKEDNEQRWLKPALDQAKAEHQGQLRAFRGANVGRGALGRFTRLEL